ncbi:MAG: CoA pyrophosphatase [Prolixibacteraceae bacterium]
MKTLSPDHIARLLKSALPGKESHLKMMPPGRELVVNHHDIDLVRYSSVLLLLLPADGQIYTCLIKRNASMRHHPGQISLPGGKIEDGESPEITALREAQEEIGISPLDVQLLGRLSELYVSVSRYTIFPYVGWMNYKPNFILNEAEAEKLLLLPVQQFRKKLEISQALMRTSLGVMKVPCYLFEEEIIWGATAMILTEFFDLIGESGAFISQ